MPNREMEGLYAEFHLHPVLQVEESKKRGQEIYKDELYVTIQIKGQKNQIRDRKATKQDENDFPSAWERWTNKEKSSLRGTPSTALPGIGPSMALELQALGLYTVEDIATIPDSALDKFRGALMLRQRAVAYLKASEILPETPMTTETEDMAKDDHSPVDIDAMKSDTTVVQAEPRRRGRPPKVRTLQ